MDTLSEQLIKEDWVFVVPNFQKIYKIRIFDDGNSVYTKDPNEWIIFGEWKGKNALVNSLNSNLIIQSISSWKLELIN